uniref:Phosphatidylinositol-glycan biosynthesis class W protein n=1 Tax=Macrostomum lignano TaxID=282301 RepID=A0A1I8G047_9PLAT
MGHLLKAFAVFPMPPPPMHLGSNLTIRSRYYESFLINGASFSATSCLICAARYAFGVQLASLRLQGLTVQLAVFLILSIPFLFCILDYPFTNYTTFLVPYSAVSVALAMIALGHRTWPISIRRCRDLLAKVSKNSSGRSAADFACLITEKRPFDPILSAYRCALYICTSLCIFCRDLPCWNNQFSKSKTFGTGLMDLGIGCFVICLGTVAPTAQSSSSRMRLPRAQMLQPSVSHPDRAGALHQPAKVAGIQPCHEKPSSGPADRPGSAKGPVPPTHLRFAAEWWEYGVHWSAFYSLAIARALGTALELLTTLMRQPPPPLLLALLLALAHEAVLATGLAKAVLAPGHYEPYNRSSLIGQNREGLASIPGLLALYFAGVQLGRWVRDRRWMKIVGLLLASLLVRPLAVVQFALILPESRRLLNLAYCAWTVAISCSCLLCAALLSNLRGCLSQQDSAAVGNELLQLRYLAEFDQAGFLSFLLSNLATGVFNAALGAAGVNREQVLGCGWICFASAVMYSVTVQLAALQLLAAATKSAGCCWQQRLKSLYVKILCCI